MKTLVIDPMDYEGHPRSFPAYVARQLRKAGFRLEPLPFIMPTAEQVQDALTPPWEVEKGVTGVLTVTQD